MAKKVAWDYIVPVKLPADLKGVEPGKLSNNLLVGIPGGGKLHRLAANAWLAMVAKAKAEGVELKPTSAGDTYRSYESQKSGFLTRYQLEPIPGQSTKTFEGKTWYLKKGMAMLATPGKSQHNLGIAVDIHSASEPKRLNWLIANVKDFGWSWEVVPSEPWHIRYVAGDAVPAAVAAFTGGEAAPAAPAAEAKPAPAAAAPAATAPAAAPAAESGEVLDVGARGPRVRQLQQALKAKGIYQGPVDGEYSATLGAAVKKFKTANKLAADTKAGGKVFTLLGI
jgi:hypothetical protein